MTTPYDGRARVLKVLLTEGPSLDALENLTLFAPAQGGPVLTLRVSALHHALTRFLEGAVSAGLLERWAEDLNTAEDVELDPADREFLAQALFELSTPELFAPVEQVALELLVRLPQGLQEL